MSFFERTATSQEMLSIKCKVVTNVECGAEALDKDIPESMPYIFSFGCLDHHHHTHTHTHTHLEKV